MRFPFKLLKSFTINEDLFFKIEKQFNKASPYATRSSLPICDSTFESHNNSDVYKRQGNKHHFQSFYAFKIKN